jgi:hypothetical protein
MPTVLRERGFQIRIYTNDHEPMHVHAVKGGDVVVINLGDEDDLPYVRENHGLKPAEVRLALEIVTAHQAFLIEEWRRIHDES